MRWFAGASALVAVCLFCPAQAAAAGVPDPAVEGPIAPGGIRAMPANGYSALNDLPAAGYTEEEFFLSGTARSFGSATPAGPTVALPQESAPYRSRVIVRRPADPGRFNGTVLVEWFNVTAGQDFDPAWIYTYPYLMREGYAFVGVTAQAAGVNALRTFLDPARYRSLSHPGDQFSMDVFSQALQAIKHPSGVNVLGDLRPAKVLVSGESQSAARLYQYIDLGVAEATGLADGILLQAGGETSFPRNEPSVPVLHFRGEEQAVPALRSTSPNYRVWWVAGAPHLDAWGERFVQAFLPAYLRGDRQTRFDERTAGTFGERGGSATGVCDQSTPNMFPVRYAMDAAVHALDRWVRTGAAPRSAPEFEYTPRAGERPTIIWGQSDGTYTVDALGTARRDADGNIRGGLRLPPISVPVAEYNGNQCFVVGYTVPFSDHRLHELYPTFEDYRSKLEAAARQSIADGYLLPADAEDLMARACAAAFRWSEAPGPGCTRLSFARRAKCPRFIGGANSARIGQFRLGRRRAFQRRVAGAVPRRSRRGLDVYCVRGGGELAVGYEDGRAVVLATTSRRYEIAGVRVGSSVSPRAGARRLRLASTSWWLLDGRTRMALVGARGNRARAVGLADRRAIGTRGAAWRWLRRIHRHLVDR